jgi:hypothetical protein
MGDDWKSGTADRLRETRSRATGTVALPGTEETVPARQGERK